MSQVLDSPDPQSGPGGSGAAFRRPAAHHLVLGGIAVPVTSPARIYTCGITPYDVTHLGHAATFVWSDVLAATIRATGSETVTSRNTTDVDDVLTAAATARGRAYDEFALLQELDFDQDMRALSVAVPTHTPSARHHVVHVQQLAGALLARGKAYVREGHVFHRGASAATSAGLPREEALQLAAEYGDDPQDARRDDPFDVPVWRPSSGDEPSWPSPWGPGRPGWHAECAAMAHATLGHTVDVVVGGADLAYPHHAHQAALAQDASGARPFARAHLHVGTVFQDGTKMAKSTGNLTLVSDLLAHHPAAAIRLLLIDRPWAASWAYRPELLVTAEARMEQVFTAAARPGSSDNAPDEVLRCLLDDLDVSGALDTAIDAGGAAARLAVQVLALR